MVSVKVIMKNGEVKDFTHEGRSGGSYTKSVRYEGQFVIIKDEWSNETAIPAHDVKEVITKRNN